MRKEMNAMAERIAARVALFGHPPSPATLVVEPRSAVTRRTRAITGLLGCWLLMPVVFFIPPHAEWVLLLFFGGIYICRKEWTAEYVLRQFEGNCPRCGTALRVKGGTTLRFPHGIPCPGCRHTCALEAGAADAPDAAGARVTRGTGFAPPPADLDLEAQDAYWRRRASTSVWSPASSDWHGGWDRRPVQPDADARRPPGKGASPPVQPDQPDGHQPAEDA
jgi:hypothetical protein